MKSTIFRAALMLTIGASNPVFAQTTIPGINMTSARMTEAEITREDVISRLETATPSKPADFSRMRLNGLDLSRLDFSKAIFRASAMNNVNLSGANLDGAVLDQAWVTNADLSDASLRRASLFMTQFGGANLDGADLFQSRAAADFTRASLKDANFTDADLSADMKNQSMGLMRGVLKKAIADGADFTGASLSRADFEFAKLRGANFTNADLSMTTLGGADLTGALVSGAKFRNADVTSTRLKDLKGKTGDQFDKAKNLNRAFQK